MKKFTFLLLSMFFLVILTIISTNFFIDGGNQFKSKNFYKKLSQEIFENNQLKSIYNIEHILLKKTMLEEYFKAENLKPDIINLGSSRMWSLKKEHFSEKLFFNLSAPLIKIKDYISIISYLEKNELLPQNIIIEIYPEIFSDFYSGFSHPSMIKDYYLLADKLGIKYEKEEEYNIYKKNFFYYLKTLISTQYFQTTLKYLLYKKNIFNEKDINTEGLVNENTFNFTIYKDGSVIPPKFILDMKKDGKEIFFKALVTSIKKYNINKNSESEFELLIKYLSKKPELNLSIYLPAYSPQVYDLVKDFENLNTCMKFVNYLCEKYKISKIGDYSPARFNLEESDYYDHVHIKYNNFHKIIKTHYPN